MHKTIFKRIIDREIPAKIVYEDDRCLAFEDVNPQAPVHILVIPKKEIPSLADLSEGDAALAGHLLVVIQKLAAETEPGRRVSGRRQLRSRRRPERGASALPSVGRTRLRLAAGVVSNHEKYRSHFRRRRNQRCRPAAGGGTDRDLRGNGGQGLLGPAAQPAPDAEIPRRSAAEFDPRGKRRRAEGGRATCEPFELEIRARRRVSQRQPAADVVAGHGPGQRTAGQAARGPGERAESPSAFPRSIAASPHT